MPATKLAPYKTWLKRYLKGPSWPERAHVVSIVWDDATYAEEIATSGLARACTIGIVVEATPEYLKTAAEFFADKSVRDVTTVPAGMIVGIYTLGFGDLPGIESGPVPKRRR